MPSILSHILPTSISSLIVILPALALLYQLSIYFYNYFLHPLASFPGPRLAAISTFPKINQALRGNQTQWIVAQHLIYGPVLRVSPNELSFSGAEAWKDVYAHKTAGRISLPKDPTFYRAPGPEGEAEDLVTASDAGHARQRRLFAHAFSDRALKRQEPLFTRYVANLRDKLRDAVAKDPAAKFDFVRLLNYTTFDIMGDLTFGESLDMLQDSGYHPWVAAILAGFRFGTYLHCIRNFPALERTLMGLIPKGIREKQKLHHEFSHARVDRRLEKADARPDIWGLVLEKERESEDGSGGMSRQEMYANSNLFMIAGTETTATLLSGLLYYLLVNPEKMDKLTAEIRGEFETEEDIAMEKLQALKYLHGCIEEGLRMYPPVSVGLPRVVPSGGAVIDGHQIPTGSIVYVTHLAAYRNPDNFRLPNSFIPERWETDNAAFASDKRHALQPFSTGPRMCLGKNMAYHEMRLILATLLWNFDLKLCSESERWANQKMYIMWDKPPLYCQMSVVKR